MDINNFTKPNRHPFDMLDGIPQAHEKESFMAWFLAECIKAKDLHAHIKTRRNEDYMSQYDLLEIVGCNEYKLTTKAIGLLYSVYGKQVVP